MGAVAAIADVAGCGKVADVPIYVVLPEANVPGVTPVFQDVKSLRISVRGGTPGGADMVVFASHVEDLAPGGKQVLSIHGLTGGRGRFVVLEGLKETAAEIANGQTPTVIARGVSPPEDYLAPGQNEPTGKRYPPVTLFFGRVGEFSPLGSTLSDARAFFATVDLQDGRYAFAGGVGYDDIAQASIALPSVELFDANLFGFERASADLAAPRAFAAVAPLPGGGALLAGGASNPAAGAIAVDQAEFLDGNGQPTGQTPKAIARVFAAGADFLSNGSQRALIAGGSPVLDVRQPDSALQELVSGALVSDLLSLNVKRSAFTATELLDGRVLMTGGFARVPVFGGTEVIGATDTAELFDKNATPSHADVQTPMVSKRWGHTATRLDDGTVLVADGAAQDPDADGLAPAIGSFDVFYPETDSFRLATPLDVLDTPRAHHSATRMSNGDVFFAGGARVAGAFLMGSNGNLAIGCASIFHAHEAGFVDAGRMIIPRYGHAAVSLPGGQLMVVGGYGPDGHPQATGEIYTPCWSAQECADAGHPEVPPPRSCP